MSVPSAGLRLTASHGIAASEEEAGNPPSAPLPSVSPIDLKAANITAVVWGTGYRFDFDWVKLPVFDGLGAPVQQRGVTRVANAYFLGLHWMHTFKSGVLFGVGDDAAYIVDHMDSRSADWR